LAAGNCIIGLCAIKNVILNSALQAIIRVSKTETSATKNGITFAGRIVK